MDNNGWGAYPAATATIGHNGGPAVEYEVKYAGQPKTEEAEAFRLRRNHELQTWLNSKPVLESAKTNEMDLRKRITATLFPSPVVGTQRYDIGGGYKVKLVYGLTYSLGDKNAVRESDGSKYPVREQVEDLEKRIIDKYGDAGIVLLKSLITWSPSLSGSEYEKLDPNNEMEAGVANMIGEILTIKPASPTLTFEEPKEG